MKNLNKFLMLFTSAALLITSCQKDETKPVSAELTVSGGTTVSVSGKDAEGTVTVTAAKAVTDDVTVSLAVAPATGEAVLEKQEIVITKGATSASTKITFPLTKFPQGADQVKITVTATSTTPGVKLITPSTDFFVDGGGKPLPFELTITAKSTTINTDEKDGVAELSFVLTKLATEDVTISYSYDEGKTLADADFKWNPEAIVIAKDGMTKSATITVPKGKEGKLPIKFSIANKDITLKTEKIELKFQIPPFPDAPVSLCLPEIKYRNYVITKTFTVGDYTLAPEHDLNGAYGLDDKTKTVTANVSTGSLLYLQAQNRDNKNGNDEYAYVMWIDWNRNGKLSDNELVFKETWKAGPMGGVIAPYVNEMTIPEGTIEGKYYARVGVYFTKGASLTGGCGKIETSDFIDIAINYKKDLPLTATLAAEGTTDFTVVGKMQKTVTVKLNKKHTAPVTVNLAINVTGGSGSATLLASSVTVPAGQTSVSTKLVFDEANFPMGGQPTFINVDASSTDATVNPNANKVAYTARCLGPNGTLTSYCKVGDEGYSYATVAGGSVGGVTLRAGNPTRYNEYIDLSQDVNNRAKIKVGSEIKASLLNTGAQGSSGAGDTFEFVVFADWNKDGDFADAGEVVARQDFVLNVDKNATQVLSPLVISSIPADAQKISTMRIIVNFVGSNSVDGCQKVESSNIYDVAYILE